MALSSIMTRSLLSANTSRQIAHVQQSVKKQMDGHAGVLEAEIKLDGARGADTKKKQEELEETQKKAAELTQTTVNTLAEANEDLRQAAKEDQEVQRAEKAAEKKKVEKAAEKKRAEKKAAEERIEKAAETNASENVEPADGVHVVSSEVKSTDTVSIDIISEGVSVSSGTVTVSTGKNVDVKA